MRITIDITHFGDVAVARCRGPLTRQDEYDFRSRLRTLLPEHAKLVLDCAELEWVDSGGLGALVAIFVSFRSFAGDIRLAAMPPAVREGLKVCSLDKVFKTFATAEEAVRSYHPLARSV